MMKKRTTLSLLLVASLAVVGCKDKKESAGKDGAASATASGKSADDDKGKSLKDKLGLSGTASGAAAHIPKDCAVMGVIDIAGTLKHPAVAESIVPKLKAGLEKEPANKEKSFQAFVKETGMDPLKDVSSVAFCLRNLDAKEPNFVAIIGGNFKAGSILPALKKTGKDTDAMIDAEIGGVKALTSKENDKFVAQAKDNAVVLGNNKAIFEAGLGTSSAAADAKLPTDKTMAFIVEGSALKTMVEKGGDNPLKKHLVKMKRVSSVSDMTAGTSVTRVLMPDNVSAVEFGGMLKTVMDEMQKKPQRGMPPMLSQMLKDIKITYEDAEVVATSTIPAESMNQAIQMAGMMMMKEMK